MIHPWLIVVGILIGMIVYAIRHRIIMAVAILILPPSWIFATMKRVVEENKEKE